MLGADAEATRAPEGDAAPLFRHTAYYFIGRVATGAVGVVSLVVFTRILSPSGYGRYAVILSIAALCASVGFQWLRQCLVRFGTGSVGMRQPLLGTLGALFLGLLGGLVVITATAAAIPDVGRTLNVALSPLGAAAICCLIATQAWFEFTADAARMEYRPWRYSAATLTRSLLSLALGLIAVLLTHRILMVVLAMGLAYLLSSALAMPRWFVGLRRLDLARWHEVRRLAAYGLPLAGTLGLTFILNSADRLMLAGMRGYAETGIYSSAYNLAQFSIGTLLAGLGLGSLPLAVGAFVGADRTQTVTLLERNLGLGIAIGLPAVIGLVLVAPGLDRLLLGNYTPGRSGMITSVVAAGTGLAAIRSYCVDVVFMVCQRTWLQALVIGVAAALNVLLNVILIPPWGAMGSALATFVAFSFAFLGSWMLSRRYIKIRLSLRDTFKVLVGCGLMALAVKAVTPNDGAWTSLLLAVVCGGATYALATIALDVLGSRHRLIAAWANRSNRAE